MPLSLTCTCGAKLEIDEAFIGQTIPCPDCTKPIQCLEPLPELPPRTSGMALASFACGLVGFFTFAGSVLAIALAVLARSDLASASRSKAGRRFANAGLALGIVGIIATLVAFASPEILGLDAIFRYVSWSSRLRWPYPNAVDATSRTPDKYTVKVELPSARWGHYDKRPSNSRPEQDDLILINPRQDIMFTCLPFEPEADFANLKPEKKAEACLAYLLRKSELVQLLEQTKENAPPEIVGTIRPDSLTNIRGNDQSFVAEATVGGIRRTLFVVVAKRTNYALLAVLARKSRYAQQEEEIKTLMTDKVKVDNAN